MVYLAGQKNAAGELHRKAKKLSELSLVNKSISKIQGVFYEKAAEALESHSKIIRQRYEGKHAPSS